MTSCLPATSTNDGLVMIHVNPLYVTSITSPTRAVSQTSLRGRRQEQQHFGKTVRRCVIRRRYTELPYRVPAYSTGNRRLGESWSSQNRLPSTDVTNPFGEISYRSHQESSMGVGDRAAVNVLSTDVRKAEGGVQGSVDVITRSQSLDDLHLRWSKNSDEPIEEMSRKEGSLDIVVKHLHNFHVKDTY